MHGATASSGTSGGASEQFGHQFSGRHTFRQCMSMASMRAEHGVRFCQMSTDSGRNCFLPDIRMARSVNQPALVTASKLFLGLPDDAHCAV
jgi:hypothetical protein